MRTHQVKSWDAKRKKENVYPSELIIKMGMYTCIHTLNALTLVSFTCFARLYHFLACESFNCIVRYSTFTCNYFIQKEKERRFTFSDGQYSNSTLFYEQQKDIYLPFRMAKGSLLPMRSRQISLSPSSLASHWPHGKKYFHWGFFKSVTTICQGG